MIDPDWLDALRRRLDAPPAAARLPLRLAGVAADIGSIEAGLAARLAEAGAPIAPRGSAWAVEPPPGATSPDASFAALAYALRTLGAASVWRDERLAVTDATGAVVGAIERAAVRPLGIATDAVHLVASRADGRVWVQRRAANKSTDPGLWDTTMGGLVAAGESLETALLRETWEEAGLRPEALHGLASCGRFTVRRPVAHGWMVERTELFAARVDDDVLPVNRDGEVDRFECLDPAALVERLHAGCFTLEAAYALALWLQRRQPA